MTAAPAFSESEHPRDNGGKFATKTLASSDGIDLTVTEVTEEKPNPWAAPEQTAEYVLAREKTYAITEELLNTPGPVLTHQALKRAESRLRNRAKHLSKAEFSEKFNDLVEKGNTVLKLYANDDALDTESYKIEMEAAGIDPEADSTYWGIDEYGTDWEKVHADVLAYWENAYADAADEFIGVPRR